MMEFKENEIVYFENERGKIKFIGGLEGKEGVWVGIKLDGEKGLNDGSFNGRSYFDCGGKMRGLFVLREKLAREMLGDDYKAKYQKLKIHMRSLENSNRMLKGDYNIALEQLRSTNKILRKEIEEYRECIKRCKNTCGDLIKNNEGLVKSVDRLHGIANIGRAVVRDEEERMGVIRVVESLLQKIESDEPIDNLYEEFKDIVKRK